MTENANSTVPRTSNTPTPAAHIEIPAPDTAPGLGYLTLTDKLFIVKQKKRIPFKTLAPMASYYQILDQDGKHIYTLGQADPREKDKYFLMELFTVEGQLILKIVQRWDEPVKSDDEDLNEIIPYLKKDQKLPSICLHREGTVLTRIVTCYELKEDDPNAQVHIRHLNGDFLGHVWKGTDCWIVHDANLVPRYTFPKVSTNQESSKYSENARHKLECWGENYSYYEFYHAHGLEALSRGEPIGFIETEINIEKFGIQAVANHCSCAHFPPDLSPVDKVLVLAMALSQYCRASTSAEKAGCTCLWLCIFLSLLLCLTFIAGTIVGMCIGVLDTCRTVKAFSFIGRG